LYSGGVWFEFRPGHSSPDCGFSWLYCAPPAKCRGGTLNYATSPSFRILSSSLFTIIHSSTTHTPSYWQNKGNHLKLPLCLIKRHVMKAHGGVEV
jgi:hypothetical protein